MKATCNARTRRGTTCQCKPLKFGGRCKFHGGASTGPKTPEGRQQAAKNLGLARAALAGDGYAENRRQRSLKGWSTRRRRAWYQRIGLFPALWK